MHNNIELAQKIFIIKTSDLDDIIILDNNYKQLIRETPDSVEKEQYKILQHNSQHRIEVLTAA